MTARARFAVVGGGIGLLVAGVLSFSRAGFPLPTSVLLTLWPTSLLGMIFDEPPVLSIANAVLLIVEYGGNVLLYGLLAFGLSLFAGRGSRER